MSLTMIVPFIVPDDWDEEGNTVIGYFSRDDDTYAILYIKQKRAIAISSRGAYEVPYDSIKYVDRDRAKADIRQVEIPEFS